MSRIYTYAAAALALHVAAPATGISENIVGSTVGVSRPAVLALRCQDGERSLALSWPGYVGFDQVTIEWRAGTGEIREEIWGVLRNAPTVALTYGKKQVRRLFAAMETGDKLIMRVHAYRGAQDVTFDLAGAAPAVAAMREACPRE